MKKLTKPISSPGRTEKFPPPLMRFLRSNVGSKSRRRSRASPMFIRKKNTVTETTQEPSSPKVTCIGQVRVRRSKKTTTTTTTSHHHHHHHRNRLCRCLRKLKPTSCLNILSKWVSFFRCGYCKQTTDSHDSPAIESPPTGDAAGDNGEEQEQDENVNVIAEADSMNQGLILRSPPRNALLLTRCRSAPYRSSSLASKFWESTIEKTGDEDVAEKLKNLKIIIKKEEVNGDESEVTEEGTCNESNGDRELKAIKGAPLILTRCKSEPARTWDQLRV